MILHGVTAVRAESLPGNIERSKISNNFPFGGPLGPLWGIDWGRFIVRMITIRKPLGGFDEGRFFTVFHVLDDVVSALQDRKWVWIRIWEGVRSVRIEIRIRLY